MPATTIYTVEPTVRSLDFDEEYVVNAFHEHAVRCPRCIDPLKTFDKGATLCDRGNLYAVDVDRYIYSKNNVAHSAIDRDLNNPTLVQVGVEYEPVRRLLLAVQFGLPLCRKEVVLKKQQNQVQVQKKPVSAPPVVISYDQTYPVAPRRPAETSYEVIQKVSHSNKDRRAPVYPSSRTSPGRGSLYERDYDDRSDRRTESPRSSRRIDYH